MKKLTQHVDYLFRDIPENEQKNAVKQEVLENLEEKTMNLMAHGKAEEDAINKVVLDFGDIDDLL
ncbi:permease prefix domain 1-containing protein [Radiobacillus sp. PE A8.2]|uniref:permease prefix domain 1-containing protein n=1 Tax=Radiobacillus sp. PE A8.2 TaxID=3380349 RepID=UPI00388DAB3F